jgi:uncharacterized protein YndB with AHSA1/START domain
MVFLEIEEPERLVFAWEPQRGLGAGMVVVTCKDRGDKTEVSTHYSGLATDQIFEASGVGWNQQLDRLAGLLAQALTRAKEEHTWEGSS